MQIPDQYLDAKVSDFGEETKRDVSDAVAAGKMITLVGSTGTGKTRLVMAVYRQLRHGHKCMFIRVPEYVMELQSTYSEWGAHEVGNMVKKACDQDILILDDLGSEKTTEFVRASLFLIINHREMHGLCTFVTSNKSLGEISETLEERIASRLAAGLVIELDGADRRLSKGVPHD